MVSFHGIQCATFRGPILHDTIISSHASIQIIFYFELHSLKNEILRWERAKWRMRKVERRQSCICEQQYSTFIHLSWQAISTPHIPTMRVWSMFEPCIYFLLRFRSKTIRYEFKLANSAHRFHLSMCTMYVEWVWFCVFLMLSKCSNKPSHATRTDGVHRE